LLYMGKGVGSVCVCVCVLYTHTAIIWDHVAPIDLREAI